MKAIKYIIGFIILQLVMMIPILNVFIYAAEVSKGRKNAKLLNMLKSKLYVLYTKEGGGEITFNNLDELTSWGDPDDFKIAEKWLQEDVKTL